MESEQRKSRYELFLEEEARKAQPTKQRTSNYKRKYKSREDQFWKMFWAKVERVNGCLEWKGTYTSTGQPCCPYKRKSKTLVRRLVYQLAIGPVADDMFVLTTCNNTRCVSQFHMEQGTADDLEFKRVTHTPTGDAHYARTNPEKLARGSRNARTRITERDVENIPVMRREMSVKSIADHFGVSIYVIYGILSKRNWRHVDIPELTPSEKPKFLPKGEQHGMAKLNANEVREIRTRFNMGESKLSIAKAFNVGHATVRRIIAGETWKHVQ